MPLTAKKKQYGNILFLILIAVALLAALSYAVTNSTRSGGGNTSSETGSARAADLMNYLASMNSAIQRMRIMDGVQDYELNFYYSPVNNFIYGSNDNLNCIATRCRVFDPNGGGVVGRQLENYTRGNFANPERILYLSVPGVGTAAPDIVFTLHGVTTDICKDINRRAGLSDIIYNTIIPTNPNTLMYQVPLPTGPIPDLGETMAISSTIGQTGTFCTCDYANQNLCETTNNFRPVITHVLVPR